MMILGKVSKETKDLKVLNPPEPNGDPHALPA